MTFGAVILILGFTLIDSSGPLAVQDNLTLKLCNSFLWISRSRIDKPTTKSLAGIASVKSPKGTKIVNS